MRWIQFKVDQKHLGRVCGSSKQESRATSTSEQNKNNFNSLVTWADGFGSHFSVAKNGMNANGNEIDQFEARYLTDKAAQLCAVQLASLEFNFAG